MDLLIHFRLALRRPLLADGVDPFLDPGCGLPVGALEAAQLPGRVHQDLRLHEAAVEDVKIEGRAVQQHVGGLGHAAADMVGMVRDADDLESGPRHELGRRAVCAPKLDPVPRLPAHLLGDAGLHSALELAFRQPSLPNDGPVDALRDADHRHIHAHVAGGHLRLGHEKALHVYHALERAQDLHVLRGQQAGGDDLHVPKVHAVIEVRAVAVDGRGAVVHAEEHGHPQQGDDHDGQEGDLLLPYVPPRVFSLRSLHRLTRPAPRRGPGADSS